MAYEESFVRARAGIGIGGGNGRKQIEYFRGHSLNEARTHSMKKEAFAQNNQNAA